MTNNIPGPIAFLGSGETSLAGGRIFESIARILPGPLHIAILETPAGFELNSTQVAGRVGDFLATRLQNYRPTIDLIPARKRGTQFSPEDPAILAPLLQAGMIFMGAGSPTYAVRQLAGTLAWDIIRLRHRMGASLVFASAATISIGAWVLPVYEIYKVGEDVHTRPGLNLFEDYGVALSFIPHWNNTEGGADLDTSRCFIGMDRFAEWCDMLPPGSTTLGLDEHTGIIINFEQGICDVGGVSSVSLVRECNPEIYAAGTRFPLTELGDFHLPVDLEQGISAEARRLVSEALQVDQDTPPEEVTRLAGERAAARDRRDFAESDRLRDEILALGWQVQDSRDGQRLIKP